MTPPTRHNPSARLVASAAALLLVHLVQPLCGQPPAVWDLARMPYDSAAVYFTNAGGGQLGVPVVTGDFDGDGFLDVAASPFTASTKARTRNGTVEILFGDGNLGFTINMADYTGRRLVIHGAQDQSLLGVEMAAADLDGDGRTDLVMGSSHGVNFDEAPRAGEAFVLYGDPDLGVGVREIDTRLPVITQRHLTIVGERNRTVGSTPTGDRLGSWFTIADLDANGTADVVIGADQSAGPGDDRAIAGSVVIWWDATPPAEGNSLRVGRDTTSFTVIHGRDAGDMFGHTHTAADLDGDGATDLVIGAGVTRSGLSISALGYQGTGGGDGVTNSRSNSGEALIIWNAAALRDHAVIDLANESALQKTFIYGQRASDYFGEEIVAGDVTGDGVAELLVGALGWDGPGGLSLSGIGYIYPGGSWLRSQAQIEMANPPAGRIVALYGTDQTGIAADTLEVFDITGDGVCEIFFGIPYGTPLGRFQAGYTTVIFGGQNLPTIPTFVPIGTTAPAPFAYTCLYGADSPLNRGDYLAYSSAFGDLDGDGVADYVPNAMQGDGFGNAYMNAGEFYAMGGDTLARFAAAPANPRLATGTTVAAWDAAQAIFGPATAYEVLLRTGENDEWVAVVGLALTAELAAGRRPIAVRSVFADAEPVRYSLAIDFPLHNANAWQLE